MSRYCANFALLQSKRQRPLSMSLEFQSPHDDSFIRDPSVGAPGGSPHPSLLSQCAFIPVPYSVWPFFKKTHVSQSDIDTIQMQSPCAFTMLICPLSYPQYNQARSSILLLADIIPLERPYRNPYRVSDPLWAPARPSYASTTSKNVPGGHHGLYSRTRR